jgi:hypothetical protein
MSSYKTWKISLLKLIWEMKNEFRKHVPAKSSNANHRSRFWSFFKYVSPPPYTQNNPFWNSYAADHMWLMKFICGRWYSSTRDDLKNWLFAFLVLQTKKIWNHWKKYWKSSFFLLKKNLSRQCGWFSSITDVYRRI